MTTFTVTDLPTIGTDYATDVTVISIVAWLEARYGAEWWKLDSYTPESCAEFQAWCKENKVHYYARPRENFFTYKACEEACAKGLKWVIVEDLS